MVHGSSRLTSRQVKMTVRGTLNCNSPSRGSLTSYDRTDFAAHQVSLRDQRDMILSVPHTSHVKAKCPKYQIKKSSEMHTVLQIRVLKFKGPGKHGTDGTINHLVKHVCILTTLRPWEQTYHILIWYYVNCIIFIGCVNFPPAANR